MSTFQTFGVQHGVATFVTVSLSIALPWVIHSLGGPGVREWSRRILASCLLAYLVVGPVVRAGVYDLPLAEHLPLHLCGASVALGALMLWFRSYGLYEIVYFWGTGGVLAALLTPDLLEGFPHPLFLLFFLGHGLALTGVTFATFVWGFRPRALSIPIALTATAVYAALIYPVNLLLGSNYLYLIRKPAQASPLDYLGPWPWYIIGLGVLTLCVCGLCYLPFAFRASGSEMGRIRSNKKN